MKFILQQLCSLEEHVIWILHQFAFQSIDHSFVQLLRFLESYIYIWLLLHILDKVNQNNLQLFHNYLDMSLEIHNLHGYIHSEGCLFFSCHNLHNFHGLKDHLQIGTVNY